ncbi:MAG: hypothetical protein JNL92_00525 [Opitutaceae bacterium]|nr:hypothetical protein [Opitutaceae bacterium]
MAARGTQQRWFVAVGVAVVVMTAFVALVNVAPAPVLLISPLNNQPGRPTVKIARPDETDALLKEESELRDLRPLFLPTDRNVALPDPRLEPGRTMLDSEGLKRPGSDPEVQLGAELPPVATIGGKPAGDAGAIDAFDAEAASAGLLGFGRKAREPVPFRPRGGFIEVTAWADGRRLQAEDLPVEARPPNERPWSPLELIAVIDRAGLASPLVVTEGSRVEEVDLHFKNFLTSSYRIGERLPPGIYRIVVAP